MFQADKSYTASVVLDGAELSYFGQEGMQEVVVGESKVNYVLKYLQKLVTHPFTFASERNHNHHHYCGQSCH